jgi:hypothetical protein
MALRLDQLPGDRGDLPVHAETEQDVELGKGSPGDAERPSVAPERTGE